MGNLCGDGSSAPEMNKKAGRPKLTDNQAWKEVNDLWAEHGLKENEHMNIELARPFITAYVKEVKGEKKIDDGLITQIFNDIDEDDSMSIDRTELFTFIKKRDFKPPNQVAVVKAKKTMNDIEDHPDFKKAITVSSIYAEADLRIE